MPFASRRCGAVVLALVVATATPATAQRAVNVGSAVGLGLGGMTEARLAEAALWNPALAGLFDGPARSVSYPGVVGSANAPRALVAYERLFRDARGTPHALGSQAARLEAWARGRDLAMGRAELAAQWVGLSAPTVALSLSSYASEQVRLPARAAGILAADPQAIAFAPSVGDVAAARDSRAPFYRASTAAFAKAADAGVLPGLGRTWVGVTGKASLVHQYAHTTWGFGDALALASDTLGDLRVPSGAGVLAGQTGTWRREVGIRDALVYGADLGAVATPAPSVLLSLAVANVYQYGSFRRAALPAYQRRTAFVGRDEQGHAYVIDDEVRVDARGADSSWYQDAAAHATGAHFTAVVRSGVSVDGVGTRLVLGVAQPVGARGIDYETLDRWSVGLLFLDKPARPRLAYSRRTDRSGVFTYAIESGLCGKRQAVSLGYVHAPGVPRTVEIGVSWAKGLAPCATADGRTR